MNVSRYLPVRRGWQVCAALLLALGLAQSALAQDDILPGDVLATVTELPMTIAPETPTPESVPPTLPPLPTATLIPPTLAPEITPIPTDLAPTLPSATLTPEAALPTPTPELMPTVLPLETATPVLETPSPTTTILAPASIVMLPDMIEGAEPGVWSFSLFADSLAHAQQLTIICQADPALLHALQTQPGDLLTGAGVDMRDDGVQADGSWTITMTYAGGGDGWQGSGALGSLQYQVIGAGTVDITCLFQALDALAQPLPLLTPVASLPVDLAIEDETISVPTPTWTPPPTIELPPTETPIPTATATNEPMVSLAHVSGIVAPTLPLAEMTVMMAGAQLYAIDVSADGSFAVDLPFGSYQLIATIAGLPPTIRDVMVDAPALALPPLTEADFAGYAPPVDVNIIVQHYGETVPPAPPEADVNGDGIVDIYDLVRAGRGVGS